jgi:hypothetical protein
VLWLDQEGDDDVRHVAAEVDALSGFVAELDARLGQVGVGGLAGAVEAYRKIRSVLDGVSAADIERLAGRLERLRHELVAMERRLAAVRELKTLLGTAEERS